MSGAKPWGVTCLCVGRGVQAEGVGLSAGEWESMAAQGWRPLWSCPGPSPLALPFTLTYVAQGWRWWWWWWGGGFSYASFFPRPRVELS